MFLFSGVEAMKIFDDENSDYDMLPKQTMDLIGNNTDVKENEVSPRLKTSINSKALKAMNNFDVLFNPDASRMVSLSKSWNKYMPMTESQWQNLEQIS